MPCNLGHLCRRPLRWLSITPSPGIHTLVQSLPLSVGWISCLALSNTVRQREKVCHNQDEVTERLCLVSGGFSLTHLHGGKAAAILWAALWRGPHGKKLRATFSQQSTRIWGPQSKILRGHKSCQSLGGGGEGGLPQLSLQMRLQASRQLDYNLRRGPEPPI